MKKTIITSIALLILTFLACKKNDENKIPDFQGVIMIDQFGEITGTLGQDDGDWIHEDVWTDEEYALLDFPDTVSLDGTFITDTSNDSGGTLIDPVYFNKVSFYPIPVMETGFVDFWYQGYVKFKMAIVDQSFNSLLTYSCKDTFRIFSIDFSDTVLYATGEIYRMYYSLSITDSLHFYKGHGDFFVCHDMDEESCIDMVDPL